MRKLRREEGFSLVEIMVALGISAGVILGGAQLLKNSSLETSKKSAGSSEYINTFSKLFQSRNICKDTLMGKIINSDIDAIRLKDGTLYTVGQKLNEQGSLASMKLLANANWNPVANGYGPANIQIVVENKNKKSTKLIPVSVQLDSTGKVEGCSPKSDVLNADIEMYKDLCIDVVSGNLKNGKCKWTKPTVVVYVYIPAPVPASAPTSDPSGDSLACYGPICDMYQSILGRAPDFGGKAYWEEIAATQGLDAVLAGISGSKEAAGIPPSASDIAAYNSDVTNRGISLGDAVKQCGVNISC